MPTSVLAACTMRMTPSDGSPRVDDRALEREARPAAPTQDASLLADDEVAREGIALDDAFSLAVDRFEPAAHAARLALRRALHGELQLVAQIAAVRGKGQFEAAPGGVGLQLDVARDG